MLIDDHLVRITDYTTSEGSTQPTNQRPDWKQPITDRVRSDQSPCGLETT